MYDIEQVDNLESLKNVSNLPQIKCPVGWQYNFTDFFPTASTEVRAYLSAFKKARVTSQLDITDVELQSAPLLQISPECSLSNWVMS